MSPEHIHKPSDMATAHHRQPTSCHTWTNQWLNWCCRRVRSACGPQGTFDPSCHTLANSYTLSTLELVQPRPSNPFTSTAAQLAHRQLCRYHRLRSMHIITRMNMHTPLTSSMYCDNCFPSSDPAVMINACDQVIRHTVQAPKAIDWRHPFHRI